MPDIVGISPAARPGALLAPPNCGRTPNTPRVALCYRCARETRSAPIRHRLITRIKPCIMRAFKCASNVPIYLPVLAAMAGPVDGPLLLRHTRAGHPPRDGALAGGGRPGAALRGLRYGIGASRSRCAHSLRASAHASSLPAITVASYALLSRLMADGMTDIVGVVMPAFWGWLFSRFVAAPPGTLMGRIGVGGAVGCHLCAAHRSCIASCCAELH